MTNKFGGNLSQTRIDSIMSSNAEEFNLNYTHILENSWNIWLDNSDMTLSFVLNEGTFRPLIAGVDNKELESFDSVNSPDVNKSVRKCIKEYLIFVKNTFEEIDRQQDIEGYQAYLNWYYAQMKAIDDYNDQQRELDKIKQEEPQEDSEIRDAANSAFETVTRLRPHINGALTMRLKKEHPGQLSVEDFGIKLEDK